MRNIKLTIEYDGTNFSGWQIQKDKRTIEEELETALAKILKEEVKVIGSGRTDAGVHAMGQVAVEQAEHDHQRLPNGIAFGVEDQGCDADQGRGQGHKVHPVKEEKGHQDQSGRTAP